MTTVTRRMSPIARTIGSERVAFSAVLRPASSSTAGHAGTDHSASICSASEKPPVRV